MHEQSLTKSASYCPEVHAIRHQHSFFDNYAKHDPNHFRYLDHLWLYSSVGWLCCTLALIEFRVAVKGALRFSAQLMTSIDGRQRQKEFASLTDTEVLAIERDVVDAFSQPDALES